MTNDNDDDPVMALHDLSMSADPLDACRGRIGKLVMPAIVRACLEEDERNTDPKMVFVGALPSALAIIETAMLNYEHNTLKKMPDSIRLELFEYFIENSSKSFGLRAKFEDDDR